MYSLNTSVVNEEAEMVVANGDPLLETFIVQGICALEEDARAEYMASDEFKALVENGSLSEASITYLDRDDDLTRRMALAALQLEREAGGALIAEFDKATARRNAALEKITKKNMAKSKTYAKGAQKAYIKTSPGAFKKRTISIAK